MKKRRTIISKPSINLDVFRSVKKLKQPAQAPWSCKAPPVEKRRRINEQTSDDRNVQSISVGWNGVQVQVVQVLVPLASSMIAWIRYTACLCLLFAVYQGKVMATARGYRYWIHNFHNENGCIWLGTCAFNNKWWWVCVQKKKNCITFWKWSRAHGRHGSSNTCTPTKPDLLCSKKKK